ncbi:TPA: capsular biosynthesis protein, partial [Escherichia coli]
MFVITMAGLSSRFFNAGYTVPKYQLPLHGQTVFY